MIMTTGPRDHETTARRRRNRTARSVWSAWSLLPLSLTRDIRQREQAPRTLPQCGTSRLLTGQRPSQIASNFGHSRTGPRMGRLVAASPVVLWSCGLVVFILSGCQSPEPRFEPASPVSATATTPPRATLTNRLDPAWLQPGTNLFTLGPGDRLDIELADDDSTRTSTFVGPDGKIYFYLLPGLDVWGLTLAQTKALLEQQMTNYIREQPQLILALHGGGVPDERADDFTRGYFPGRRAGAPGSARFSR